MAEIAVLGTRDGLRQPACKPFVRKCMAPKLLAIESAVRVLDELICSNEWDDIYSYAVMEIANGVGRVPFGPSRRVWRDKADLTVVRQW